VHIDIPNKVKTLMELWELVAVPFLAWSSPLDQVQQFHNFAMGFSGGPLVISPPKRVLLAPLLKAQ
jgi:hypothetical protein